MQKKRNLKLEGEARQQQRPQSARRLPGMRGDITPAATSYPAGINNRPSSARVIRPLAWQVEGLQMRRHNDE